MMAQRECSSRPNTIEEKRRMRNDRKKRKRSRAKVLEAQLKLESSRRSETEQKLILYKNMSRSYWERWHWELQQRRECMVRKNTLLSRHNAAKNSEVAKVHEIDPDLLQNPRDPHAGINEVFIGRGSFGVVRLQIYRGLKVAVKELLPRTVAADVRHEAAITARLCHPYLPFLFGIITSRLPHRLVLQYHGLADATMSSTLCDVMRDTSERFHEDKLLLMLCTQMMEALRYLHEEANVLHNDLKCNNVIVCDSVVEPPIPVTHGHDARNVQIVIIDFGKGTTTESAKKYRLNALEQTEYIRRYPNIAPEVIEGIMPQSRMSDIFAAGGILFTISDHKALLYSKAKDGLRKLATSCRSPCYLNRPTAKEALILLQRLL